MRITGTRFGEIEVEDDKTIELPSGMLGFARSRRFVLLERKPGEVVSWLQSVDEPGVAFPVVDAALFGADYPNPDARTLAESLGLGGDDLAVFVVVVARPHTPLVANLLAPVVVDVAARRGAQAVLDPRRYSASAPVPLPAHLG